MLKRSALVKGTILQLYCPLIDEDLLWPWASTLKLFETVYTNFILNRPHPLLPLLLTNKNSDIQAGLKLYKLVVLLKQSINRCMYQTYGDMK